MQLMEISQDHGYKLAEMTARAEHEVPEPSPYPGDYRGFMCEHAEQRGAEYLDDDMTVIAFTIKDFYRFVEERDIVPHMLHSGQKRIVIYPFPFGPADRHGAPLALMTEEFRAATDIFNKYNFPGMPASRAPNVLHI